LIEEVGMSNRTTLQLAAHIAEATGLPRSTLQSILRRLLKAGHISQLGFGRGATAATARDAALILLVAATEIPPLQALAVGEALLALNVRKDASASHWPDALPLAATGVDQIAFLFGGGEIYEARVILGGPTWSVRLMVEAYNDSALTFDPQPKHPAIDKLKTVLGRSRQFRRHHEIPGAVLRDIGEWLAAQERPKRSRTRHDALDARPRA
jgi:hypothetical protein